MIHDALICGISNTFDFISGMIYIRADISVSNSTIMSSMVVVSYSYFSRSRPEVCSHFVGRLIVLIFTKQNVREMPLVPAIMNAQCS